MPGLNKSPRIYEVDPCRSTWRLHAGHTETADVAGALRALNGSLVFNIEDASASRIHIWTATAAFESDNWSVDVQAENVDCSEGARPLGIRFLSWRFKEIGPLSYWVPGALTICDLTRVVSLRVHGPTPEITDSQGRIRAGATAVTKIEVPWVQGALENSPVLMQEAEGKEADPDAEVALSFQIELVRRMPAGSKRNAA